MTPELVAYKAELRRIAWPLRLLGLVVVLAGAACLLWSPDHPQARLPGWGLLGFGWTLLFYTIYVRTRWAREHPYTGPR